MTGSCLEWRPPSIAIQPFFQPDDGRLLGRQLEGMGFVVPVAGEVVGGVHLSVDLGDLLFGRFHAILREQDQILRTVDDH